MCGSFRKTTTHHIQTFHIHCKDQKNVGSLNCNISIIGFSILNTTDFNISNGIFSANRYAALCIQTHVLLRSSSYILSLLWAQQMLEDLKITCYLESKIQKITQQQTTKGKRKAQVLVKSHACVHKTDSYSIPTQPLTEADGTMPAKQPNKTQPSNN